MVDTVIDVSHYQAGMKLAPFKAAGGLAVIAKASQGTTSADPSFADFRAQAAAIPIAFASYHYLTTDVGAQANWFLGCAAPVQGERIVCDWEAPGVTAAMVVSFLRAVQQMRPDLELTVYAGSAAKAPAIDDASSAWLKENTSLWLAQYTSGTPSWPTATWKTWSLWQYTDSGSVPGYVGPVDGSKFNGSNSNLLKWFGPGVPPIPAPQVATVTMTLASDTPFTLIVNGQRIDLPGATS